MKNAYTIFFIYFFIGYAEAQTAIQWQKKLGGTNQDQVSSIIQTIDGGYIAIGISFSNNGNVSGHHGSTSYYDIWVVKLNADGEIIWQKSLGGTDYEYASQIMQTSDEGYILIGTTYSYDGNININHGFSDFWVVKLNNQGNIEWEETYGTGSYEFGKSITQTKDGGYLLGGEDDKESSNYWLIKINAQGEKLWDYSYGGSGQERFGKLALTSDNGCIITGTSWSNDGNVTGHHGIADFPDYWVVKVDSMGILQWEKSLGGTKLEDSDNIIVTNDNGYLISGSSYSNDGNVTGHHGSVGTSADAWVVKLNSSGTIKWQKSLGGTNDWDYIKSIYQTVDNNFLLGGVTSSKNGTIPQNLSIGGGDAWIMNMDTLGNINWQDLIGGSDYDQINSLIQSVNGGYIFAGYSGSSDGDVMGAGMGGEDYWIVKLDTATVVSGTKSVPNLSAAAGLEIFPNPARQTIFLNTTQEEPELFVRIINQSGIQVLSQTLHSNEKIHINSLLNGAFTIIAISPSGKVYSAKMFKQE